MKCEFCGYDGYDRNRVYEEGKCPFSVKLYKHYKMHLCDRCVDKINSYHNGESIDEYWEDADAIECGFKPFPRHKEIPKYYVYCYKEIEYIKAQLEELNYIENKYYGTTETHKEHLKRQGERAMDTILKSVEKIREKYESRTE